MPEPVSGRAGAPVLATGAHGDPALVWEIAQRCIDGRHVALVGNALRQGRVFSRAEALGWCS